MEHTNENNLKFEECQETDELFEELSSKKDGLRNVKDVGELKKLSFSRDSIDDVVYTLKFIADPEFFSEIVESNASQFQKLNEDDRKKIVEYANVLNYTLQNPPVIYEFSKISPNQVGYFLYHIYMDVLIKDKSKSHLNIGWKEENQMKKDIQNQKEGMFDQMLKNHKTTEENFPDKLRGGGLIWFTQEDDTTFIHLDGVSSTEGSYFPAILKHFENNIAAKFLENDFARDKNIVICYE